MATKRGLQLDRVVLLGRTLEEYSSFFAFPLAELQGKRVLDVAGGVGSFCAEANARGIDVTAADPIYALLPEEIAPRCAADLESVYQRIGDLSTYRWTSYRDPDQMRDFRVKAYQTFLPDFARHRGTRYVAASLPHLPFPDRAFDLTLVSYFLFAYEEQFSFEFHRDSLRELMRVTRGHARIYPLVTFDAEPCRYLEPLFRDPDLGGLRFEVVPTEFEFLLNSNSYLKITHA